MDLSGETRTRHDFSFAEWTLNAKRAICNHQGMCTTPVALGILSHTGCCSLSLSNIGSAIDCFPPFEACLVRET